MTTFIQKNEDGSIEYFTEPMSIRDQFAMKVLIKAVDQSVDYRQAAQRAYAIADQMMKAREEKNESKTS